MSAPGFDDAVRVEIDRHGEWGRFAEGSAERAVLDALSARIGMPVRPVRLRIADGSRVEIDGATADASTLVQLPLRGGEFSSAHRNKIMADMFKLTWVRRVAAPHARGILCTGTNAASAFRRGAWLGRAAADMRIEVHVWDGAALTASADPPSR